MPSYETRPADASQPWIPLGGGSEDGYNNGKEATATCFCGAIQLAFVSRIFPITHPLFTLRITSIR